MSNQEMESSSELGVAVGKLQLTGETLLAQLAEVTILLGQAESYLARMEDAKQNAEAQVTYLQGKLDKLAAAFKELK